MSHPIGRHVQCVQGDAGWLFERIGRVTASRIADVVTKLKNGKYSAARESYKMELLTEFLTGRAAEHYVTAEMQFGIENEGIARSAYEIAMDVEVERVGLFIHPTIERAAASPDGTIGDDGLVEIKCPKTATHLQYILADTIPEDYLPQCAWQMACTGRSYVDFCSFDPRLPGDFNLFIKRLSRNDEAIALMEEEVRKFLGELNDMCVKLLGDRAESYEAPEQIEIGPGPERATIPSME